MALLHTPICEFGLKAPSFALPDVRTAGKIVSLEDVRGQNGTLVVFMCNHCPYVQAIIDRLLATAKKLRQEGISTVAIMSNDVEAYPDDSPEQMALWAKKLNFPFPYLWDETQEIAKAYGAVCTPDFFGYNRHLALQYRGRLDSSGKKDATQDTVPELFNAMRQIATTGQGPQDQTPSMGCSIKWKELSKHP